MALSYIRVKKVLKRIFSNLDRDRNIIDTKNIILEYIYYSTYINNISINSFLDKFYVVARAKIISYLELYALENKYS